MKEAYDKAKTRGDRAVKKALSSGHYPYLTDLEHIFSKKPPSFEVRVGNLEIPLFMVTGTKSRMRAEAFAWNFMPILENTSEFAMKWSALYEAQSTEGIRDAVKVYEYLHRFYVEEGNKRVSVLRFLDSPVIQAEVIRILPEKKDDPEIRNYYEFLDFFAKAPIYELQFSEEGSYRKFERLIGMEAEASNLRDGQTAEPAAWDAQTVRMVRSAYYCFREAYERKMHSTENISDAFLTFLTFFPISILYESNISYVGKLIDNIRKEFDYPSESKEMRIQTAPVPAEKISLKSVISKGISLAAEKKITVAFIHESTVRDSGWVRTHEMGRSYIEKQMGSLVSCHSFEDCNTTEKLEKAIQEASLLGTDLVITTSQLHLADTLKASARYPDMQFLNCSVNAARHSVRTYYSRLYEAKFIMGILAGILCENHRIGYVADYPVQGNISNINAFALGAAMTDPQAVIHLSWVGDAAGRWKEEMEAKNISIISGPDVSRKNVFDRAFGLYRRKEDGTTENLAMPVCDWGKYYEFIIYSFLRGTWNAKEMADKVSPVNYWWGMDSGVIDVILADKLRSETKKLLNMICEGFRRHDANPFTGELRDQKGVLRLKEGETLTSQEIISMNWLAENIEGRILPYERLTERGKEFLIANGVKLQSEPQEENTKENVALEREDENTDDRG